MAPKLLKRDEVLGEVDFEFKPREHGLSARLHALKYYFKSFLFNFIQACS